MRTLITTAAVLALVASGKQVDAQVVDPDIRGPARRAAGAAGEALGAPGIEDRIERRQARRGALRDPNAWRMRYYNNEWWYYTPRNAWMYYRDNRWMPYARDSYRPLPPRYATGYRGTYTRRAEPFDRPDRFAYGKPGAPGLRVGIYDDEFEPKTLHVAPGTTITWVNYGAEEHTVTGTEGNWDSGEIAPDGIYSARFKEPGTYHYVCDNHEGMEGTIVVGDAAADGAAVEDRGVDVDVERKGAGVKVEIDRRRPADVDVDVLPPPRDDGPAPPR